MDEYSEVMISMTCAVYSSKLIPKEALHAMESQRISAIVTQLHSMKEGELADAVRKLDHAAIDLSCGSSLLQFVKKVSEYLPEQVGKIAVYLYGRWSDYISHQLNPSADIEKGDPLNYGKEEFSRYVVSKIEKMSEKLSPDDKAAIRMLSASVLYNEQMHPDEKKQKEGLWSLIELLYRKTKETRELSHVLHRALIREEIWKKNLFAG